jgi:uncharacterized protein Smg (DUF494 family)
MRLELYTYEDVNADQFDTGELEDALRARGFESTPIDELRHWVETLRNGWPVDRHELRRYFERVWDAVKNPR